MCGLLHVALDHAVIRLLYSVFTSTHCFICMSDNRSTLIMAFMYGSLYRELTYFLQYLVCLNERYSSYIIDTPALMICFNFKYCLIFYKATFSSVLISMKIDFTLNKFE